MNQHEGHRARMRKRFREGGLQGFAAHEVLELLLFYAMPMRDTNPLAHRLVDVFGGLAAVLDARYEDLLAVDGVGENVATLLKLIPELGRRYVSDRAEIGRLMLKIEDVGAYMLPLFFGKTNETVMMMCLDGKHKVLGCETISEGGVNSVRIDVRRAVSTALRFNAAAVVLAHNHTSGVALPSREDVIATEALGEALSTVDVGIIDHIVIADDDFVSMKQSGLI